MRLVRALSSLWARLRLTTRLMIAVVCAVVIPLVVALGFLARSAAINAQAQLITEYQRELESLTLAITPALLAHDPERLTRAVDGFRRSPAVIAVSFRDVSDGIGFARETPAALTAPSWFAAWCGTMSAGGTRPLMADGMYLGIVTLELSPVPAINQEWARMRYLLQVLVLSVGLVFSTIWLVLRNGLKPLLALAAGAQRLSQGDFSVRLEERGSPELRVSMEGFNRMAESVEHMVSELQANAIAIARSEENLRVTVRSIGDAVIATDASGRITMMNPVAEALTGWSLQDAIGLPVARVFHIINEDSRHEVESPVDIVLREGKVVGLANHTLLVARDGTERPIADSGAPIRVAEHGAVLGVVLVFRDQSQERLHLNALRESEQLYASLAEASPAGIFRTDRDGHLVYVNAQMKAILGIDPTENVHEGVVIPLVHPDDRERLLAAWQDAKQHLNAFGTVHRVVRPDGRIVWVNGRASPLRDVDSVVVGFVGTVTDITAEHDSARKIEHLSRLYATLSQINSAIVHSNQSEALFPEVCRVAHEVGGFAAAWVVLADWETRTLQVGGVVAREEARVRSMIATMNLNADDDFGQSLTGQTLLTGKRQVCNDYPAEGQLLQFRPDVQVLGGAAVVGVPIRQEGVCVGALILLSNEKGYFSDDILALADEIGGDISYALDNFERQRQRDIAEARLRDSEERLRLSFWASRQGSYEVDMVTERVHIDAAYAQILGYPAEARDLAYADYMALHWPVMIEAERQGLRGQLRPATPNFSREDECVTRTGEKRWLRRSGAVVEWMESGRPARVLATVTDISERHALDDHLRMTAMMFDNSKDAIIISDAEAHILAVNQAFTDTTGYTAAEVVGKNPRILQSGRHDKAFYTAMWQQVLHADFWQGELWNRRKNGEIYPCLATVSVVRRPDGQATHYLGLATDITKQKEFEERITQLAYRDSLTDLPNRTLLRDRVEQNLASAHREGQSLAMLFLDLDHFKNINDSLGHSVGDHLLMEVGRRMRLAIREMDTVGRLGGDEFLLVLPNADADDAARVAQKLLTEVSKPMWIDTHTLTVTPSIGVSLFPKDGRTFDELMKSADTAMYTAKKSGRNAYHFASPEMNQAVFRRLVLESSLRRAIDSQEFVLFYQPQYEVRGRRLIGVEALIRWHQPELGFVSPAQFIPVAEESGLINPIGAWVLGEACRQAMAWQRQGFAPIRVGVNFSTRQFAARNLLDIVDQALQQSGLPGDCLEVEITESLLAGDMDYILEVLRAFKVRGIHIAVDDFGTGYSSLSYLKRFPIDRLKIDQSFVRDLVSDPDDRAIAAAVVTLGHSLGMKVIAEGVETSDQLQILEGMQCDEVQGFFLARPMPAADLTALLLGEVCPGIGDPVRTGSDPTL